MWCSLNLLVYVCEKLNLIKSGSSVCKKISTFGKFFDMCTLNMHQGTFLLFFLKFVISNVLDEQSLSQKQTKNLKHVNIWFRALKPWKLWSTPQKAHPLKKPSLCGRGFAGVFTKVMKFKWWPLLPQTVGFQMHETFGERKHPSASR